MTAQEPFRTRLKRGDTLIGTLVTLPSPEIAEILAETGFDWLFVDLEHSPMGASEAQSIVQAAGGRVDCILRVPLNDETWIKKALDTGAAGVMVPQVNTAEDARRAVRFSKYPPLGTRSVGIGRAHGYGAAFDAYLGRANAETTVVVQVEHVEAVRNLDAIVSVEGVDAVLVGPYDLSASMGKPGRVDDPEVQAAMAGVRRVCLERGMPLGVFASGSGQAKTYLREGYRLVAAGGDTLLLVQAARALLSALK